MNAPLGCPMGTVLGGNRDHCLKAERRAASTQSGRLSCAGPALLRESTPVERPPHATRSTVMGSNTNQPAIFFFFCACTRSVPMLDAALADRICTMARARLTLRAR